MSLQIGDTAPDFEVETTEGPMRFHVWIDSSWAVLFSHPKDFTPVCTTELGYMARIKPEFDRRDVKIIGLSVDPTDDHERWARDIEVDPGSRGGHHHRRALPQARHRASASLRARRRRCPSRGGRGTVVNALTLGELVDMLVAARRAGGFRYDRQARVLAQFAEHSGREGYADGLIIQERSRDSSTAATSRRPRSAARRSSCATWQNTLASTAGRRGRRRR